MYFKNEPLVKPAKTSSRKQRSRRALGDYSTDDAHMKKKKDNNNKKITRAANQCFAARCARVPRFCKEAKAPKNVRKARRARTSTNPDRIYSCGGNSSFLAKTSPNGSSIAVWSTLWRACRLSDSKAELRCQAEKSGDVCRCPLSTDWKIVFQWQEGGGNRRHGALGVAHSVRIKLVLQM